MVAGGGGGGGGSDGGELGVASITDLTFRRGRNRVQIIQAQQPAYQRPTPHKENDETRTD